MAFVVVYDACVLYPDLLRDLLVRLAQQGLIQAKWSTRILDEAFDNLAANRPDIPAERLERLRTLMSDAVADAEVEGYEPLIEGLDLPDPGDRHVLAVAIKAGAQVIVTHNLRDFPAEKLHGWDIEAKSPDDFITDQIYLNRSVVYGEIVRMADARKRPLLAVDDILRALYDKHGLVSSVTLLRDG